MAEQSNPTNIKNRKKTKQGVDFMRLLSLTKPEWKTILVGTIFLIIGSTMGLLYPQAIRLLVDEAMKQHSNTRWIDWAAFAMLIIFSVQGIAIAFRYYLFTVAGERIVARLRSDLFKNILHQEIAFFDERKTGELNNRLASDTTVLQNTVSVNVSMALRNLATVIGGVGFLIYTSGALSALILFVIPPVAVGTMYLGRNIRKYSREVQDALAVSSEVAEETIAGIRTVRAFSQEQTESKRYTKAIDHSFALSQARARVTAIFSSTATSAGYALIALVFWNGGRLVVRKEMTVGDLTSFMLYTLLVAVSLGALASLWADFMRASGAAQRVFALLDRKPTIPIDQGKVLKDLQGNLAFDHVNFSYPSRPDAPVLQQMNFSLPAGSMLAVVGPSGGGKSTIASLITRLYDPTNGTITLDSHDLKSLQPNWLREQIGIVAQEPILFSTTIRENILYGNEHASQEEVENAAKTANAHDFISRFPEGYETAVGERGIRLSGGQKQRIAIARAILKNPQILLLDEATSALDAESEHLVKEALDRLMKQRTTLVIAHRLSTVRDAQSVMVLDKGNIVQMGTHTELQDQEGLYQKLIQRQIVSS